MMEPKKYLRERKNKKNLPARARAHTQSAQQGATAHHTRTLAAQAISIFLKKKLKQANTDNRQRTKSTMQKSAWKMVFHAD